MRLRRSFGILEGDLAPLALLGVLQSLLAASLVLSQIGATSLLVATLGAEALPQAYVSRAMLLICAGLFVIPLIDRSDRLRTFTATLVLSALVLCIARVSGTGAPEYGYRALYPLVFLMKSIVYLQFWLIAGEICEIRQAKRIFPILLGFSLAGGLLAAIAASLLPLLPGLLQTPDLLLAAAALLATALVPTELVKRRYHQYLRRPSIDSPLRTRTTWMQVRSDLAMTLDSPLLRTLSATALLFSVLAQVLDYLMGRAVTARFVDASGAVDLQLVASFYAVLDGVTIGAGALVLLLLSTRLIAAVGVTRGHLAASSTFLVGFAAIGATLLVTGAIGTAFFVAVLASRVVQRVLRVSLYRSSIDLICNPVPAEQRGRARAFREVVIEPGGVLLGGVLLMAAGFVDMRVMLIGVLLMAAALVALSARLKGQYLESLVQVLREKSRVRFTSPAPTPRQKRGGMLPWSDGFDLERALDLDDAPSRLLAIELAVELREPATAAILTRKFRQEQDPRIRAAIAGALGELLTRSADSVGFIEEALADENARVRATAIEALGQLRVSDSSRLLAPFATDGEPRVRANAACAYSQIDPTRGTEIAREILTEMYDSANEQSQLSALYGMGEIADDGAVELLTAALGESSATLRHRAILGLAQTGRRASIERLVELLEDGDGATRHLVTRALERCGEGAVDPLIVTLWSADVDVRRYAVQTLALIGTPRAREALVQILSLEAEEAYYDLQRAEKLASLPQLTSVQLLRQSLAERVEQARKNVLQVLRAVYGDTGGMRLILTNLDHPEAYLRASAIEALEASVPATLLRGVLPLMEHTSEGDISERASALYQLPARGPLEVLLGLASHRSSWIRACALYAIGYVGGAGAVRRLEDSVDDPDELARLNAIEALGRVAGPASLALLIQVRDEGQGLISVYADSALREIQVRGAQA